MTEWRAVLGYEGLYEVSDTGEIRSVPHFSVINRPGYSGRWFPARVLNQRIRRRYLSVGLFRAGHKKSWSVHTLVCDAFHGPRRPGMEVRHLDGDRRNNAASNLRWGTKQENEDDKLRHCRRPLGAALNRKVLTIEKVHAILAMEGRATLKEISREVGCGLATAHHVLTGRTWGWATGRNLEN